MGQGTGDNRAMQRAPEICMGPPLVVAKTKWYTYKVETPHDR